MSLQMSLGKKIHRNGFLFYAFCVHEIIYFSSLIRFYVTKRFSKRTYFWLKGFKCYCQSIFSGDVTPQVTPGLVIAEAHLLSRPPSKQFILVTRKIRWKSAWAFQEIDRLETNLGCICRKMDERYPRIGVAVSSLGKSTTQTCPEYRVCIIMWFACTKPLVLCVWQNSIYVVAIFRYFSFLLWNELKGEGITNIMYLSHER